MQEENTTNNVSKEVTGVVQEEVVTQEVTTEVADVLPSTEVIDMVPANTDTSS